MRIELSWLWAQEDTNLEVSALRVFDAGDVDWSKVCGGGQSVRKIGDGSQAFILQRAECLCQLIELDGF